MSHFEQPPSTAESKEKEIEYDPRIPLRRDFNPEVVYRTKEGAAVIDDPDLHALMGFYRDAVKEGSLIDVGAGAVHRHYMTALEDKLSHITALDLSPKNIRLLRELLASAGFTENRDTTILKLYAEAVAKDTRYGKNRNGEKIIDNIAQKTLNPDGQPDLVIGNMYDLRKCIGEERYDNALLAFALFIPKGKDRSELKGLFSGIREHLNRGGRLIIADFGDPTEGDIRFQDEDLETFSEDKMVIENYHTNFRLDKKFIRKILKDAGFKKIKVGEKPVEAEGAESDSELTYIFVTAEN